MANEIIIEEGVFNPVYIGLDEIPNRHIFLFGGAGGGKSYGLAQNLVLKILREPGRNLLAMRKVYADIERSIFNLFKQVIHTMGLEDFFDIRTRPFKIICTMNSNEILFSGAMDIEQLKSITASRGVVTDAWLEEATEFTLEDFNQIDTRLRRWKFKKAYIYKL